MATIELVENDHQRYYCNSCDNTYNGSPREGYGYDLQALKSWVDDDGDVFVEGDTKVLVGRKLWACHDDERPCWLDEGDWSVVVCWEWQCSCGSTYTFDNDECTMHSYSTKEDAMEAAAACCGAPKPKLDDSDAVSTPAAEVTPQRKYEVGDLVRVITHHPEGARWSVGTIVKVLEAGSVMGNGNQVLRGHAVQPQAEEVQWNCYASNVEPVDEKEVQIEQALAERSRPKHAEKKTTYIEF